MEIAPTEILLESLGFDLVKIRITAIDKNGRVVPRTVTNRMGSLRNAPIAILSFQLLSTFDVYRVHFAEQGKNDAQAYGGLRRRQTHDEQGNYLPYSGVRGDKPVEGHEVQVRRIEQKLNRDQHPDKVPA